MTRKARASRGAKAVTAGQTAAAAELRARLPKARVDFDGVTGAPAMISVRDGLLTSAAGQGAAISAAALAGFAADDPNRVTKAFLTEHRKLFGFGPEALDQAKVKREFVTAHNGLRTVVWEQQVEGIPVFEGVLISHTTKSGELVNLSSRFVREAAQAASRGTANQATLVQPAVSAAQAAALAAQNVGEEAQAGAMTVVSGPDFSAEMAQKLKAPFLVGESEAKLKLAAGGAGNAAPVLGCDSDQPQAGRDVPRAGGRAKRRGAGPPLPHAGPQRCHLQCLYQRQPVAFLAGVSRHRGPASRRW